MNHKLAQFRFLQWILDRSPIVIVVQSVHHGQCNPESGILSGLYPDEGPWRGTGPIFEYLEDDPIARLAEQGGDRVEDQ